MKQVILGVIVLLGLNFGAQAQSAAGGGGSRNTAAVSGGAGTSALHTKTERKVVRDKKGRKRVVTKKVPLQEEKMYQWKNGQRATPTGHEAAPVNGQGFISGRKDSLRRP